MVIYYHKWGAGAKPLKNELLPLFVTADKWVVIYYHKRGAGAKPLQKPTSGPALAGPQCGLPHIF